MYIWWLLKFLGVFFVESLPNGNLILTLTLWQKPKNCNKTVACSHHCSLRHPAPSLGHWYTGVYFQIFDPGPSNPNTFLGLCSPGDYRQSIESPMGVPPSTLQKRSLHLLFISVYDCILRIRPKKMCYLTKVSRINLACAICWMRSAGILTYAVQRVNSAEIYLLWNLPSAILLVALDHVLIKHCCRSFRIRIR